MWAERLAALAVTGLHFAGTVYDRQRYEQVRAIAAEMAAHPQPAESVAALFALDRGYVTPKLITRGAVFRDDRILMVRETADGRWTLPGGFVDVGDSPAGSVEREVREETGLRVRAVKLAAVYDKLRHPHPPSPFHAYLLFFICEELGGSLATSVETSEVGWFAPHQLPELSVGRATAGQIARMFEHQRNPTLPTEFD